MGARVRRRVWWAAATCLLLWPAAAGGQETPTVRGPDDGRPTREVPLAAQQGAPLKRVIGLDFDGECLEKDSLVANVERWLETSRVSERLSVSVTGEQAPVLGARFWLLVDGQRASLRRFEAFSGSCEALASSLAASIALAIEAVDLSRFEPPPSRKPEPVRPVAKLMARSPLEPEPPTTRPLRKPARPGALQSVALGAQLVGGVGIAPGSSWGGGVRGELGFLHGVNLRLSVNYLVTDTVGLADGSLRTQSRGGQVGGCWGGETLTYRAQVCLDAWLAAMTAKPKYLERAAEQTLPWFAVAPGAELRFHRASMSVRFGAQLMFNLVRPRFEVLVDTRDEPLDARVVPPLGLLGTLGLDWIAW